MEPRLEQFIRERRYLTNVTQTRFGEEGRFRYAPAPLLLRKTRLLQLSTGSLLLRPSGFLLRHP